ARLTDALRRSGAGIDDAAGWPAASSESGERVQASVAAVTSVASGAYWASPKWASSASIGRAPATPIGWAPGRKNAIVGMLMMLNAWEIRGFASTSTLTTSTAPSYFAAIFSISGA